MGNRGGSWEGCPGEIEATVVVGQRVYLFTLFGDGVIQGSLRRVRVHDRSAPGGSGEPGAVVIEWVMQAEPACGPAPATPIPRDQTSFRDDTSRHH